MHPILSINNLSKTFNRGKPSEVRAVSNFKLEVEPGEIVLMMGPSGSGKTTLLTMIGGLLSPTEGDIVVDNINISELAGNDLTAFRRKNIGFIFQSFNLLQNLSALENVLTASFDQTDRAKRAKAILGRLDLQNRIDSKPNDLSGGERQRVAIARALINNPKLILADEPTANLDKKIGHEVMRLLRLTACEEGKSVIIVSHDERIKDVAHRVVYIEDGRLVKEEKGGHDQSFKIAH